MSKNPPNGYFLRDFILWGAYAHNPTLTRGYILTPPDLKAAGDAANTELHTGLVKYLHSLTLDIRVQWQWACDANYDDALNRYEAVTAATKNADEKRLRQLTQAHFRDLLAKRLLRREHLVLFISKRLPKTPPTVMSSGGLNDYWRALLQQQEAQFEQHIRDLSSSVGDTVSVQPMTQAALHAFTYLFLNPSAGDRPDAPPLDNRQSIQQNCLHSDINTDRLGRMFLDGYYNAVLILKDLGPQTYDGMIHALTKTTLINYRITVNVEPLDTFAIIKREESEHQNLQKQAEAAETFSQLTADTIKRKQAIVSRLGEGHIRRFRYLLVIRVWAASENQLAADVGAIKTAVQALRNAPIYDVHLPNTVLETFFATFPGNTFHPYVSRSKEIDDEHLANLIPLSSSFSGDLANAQALYISSDCALTGFRFHVNGLIQHTGIAGMTRTGKSQLYLNLLYQTGNYFDLDVIVEEGESHTPYTRSHGAKPIIIQKNGNVTINYLDTMGNPLDPENLAYAISLTSHMVGNSADERLNNRRRSSLRKYINIVFHEAYQEWARKNPDLNRQSQRAATAVHQWHSKRMTSDDTLFDAYAALRDGTEAGNDEILSFVDAITEAEITTYTTNDQTAHLAERHAFSLFQNHEYPRHTDLCELIRLRPAQEDDRREMAELSDLLENWSSTGEYGALFDGYTNRDFNHRVVHFELAKADNTDPALAGAVALNITGRIRQRIISLPRAQRKRFTMEELARLILMPGGPKLVKELAAQLAKYNCVLCYILQDYSQIAHVEGISTLIQNTMQWLLFRHNDMDELNAFGAKIQLPTSMRETIANFPLPSNLPVGQQYSAACYFSRVAHPQILGAIRHIDYAKNN